MILNIDVYYSIPIESKKLAEIRGEFSSHKIIDECPTAKVLIDSAINEFKLKLCERIVSNL